MSSSNHPNERLGAGPPTPGHAKRQLLLARRHRAGPVARRQRFTPAGTWRSKSARSTAQSGRGARNPAALSRVCPRAVAHAGRRHARAARGPRSAGADSPQRAATNRSTPTTRPAFTVAGRAEPVPDTAQSQLANTIRDPEHVVDTEPVTRVRP